MEKSNTKTNKLVKGIEDRYKDFNSSSDELVQSFFGNDTEESFSMIYDYENDEYIENEPLDLMLDFKTCGCLPSCSSIHYDAEISQTKINVRKHLRANQVFDVEEEK